MIPVVAYHEAAHCVLAHAFATPVASVMIDAAGGGEFRARAPTAGQDTSAEHEDAVFRALVDGIPRGTSVGPYISFFTSTLAGPIAAMRVDPTDGWYHASSEDRER